MKRILTFLLLLLLSLPRFGGTDCHTRGRRHHACRQRRKNLSGKSATITLLPRLRETLKQGDIVIGNLEVADCLPQVLSSRTRNSASKLDPKAAPALKNAGFTHLSLANNHILDYGEEGLRQTLAALDANSIIYLRGRAESGFGKKSRDN